MFVFTLDLDQQSGLRAADGACDADNEASFSHTNFRLPTPVPQKAARLEVAEAPLLRVLDL